MPISKIVPGTTNATEAAETINEMVDNFNAAEEDGGYVVDSDLGALAKKATVDNADIANGAVTNAKIANMAAWTLKGRNAATEGAPQDITFEALSELTFPAVENYFLGFNLTGQLRKLQIKQLPVQDTVQNLVDSRLSAAQRSAIDNLPVPTEDFADLAEATAAYTALLNALKAT